MSIVVATSHFFDPSVRQRGSAYADQGRVQVLRGSSAEVRARVRGTQMYEVTLAVRGSKLVASCQCPYAEADFCKHMWAVLRTCDRAGHLGEASRDGTRKTILTLAADARDDPATTPLPVSATTPAANDVDPARSGETWRTIVNSVTDVERRLSASRIHVERELAYVIEPLIEGSAARAMRLRVLERTTGRSKWKALNIGVSSLALMSRVADRLALGHFGVNTGRMLYSDPTPSLSYGARYEPTVASFVDVPLTTAGRVLIDVVRTGRAFLNPFPGDGAEEPSPIALDEGPPWEAAVEVELGSRDSIEVTGWVVRGEERVDVVTPALIVPGLVVARGRALRVRDEGAFAWLSALRQHGVIAAPARDADDLLTELHSHAGALGVQLSPKLNFERVELTPELCARFSSPRKSPGEGFLLEAKADYRGLSLSLGEGGPVVLDTQRRRRLVRDQALESRALETLTELGVRPVVVWQAGSPATELRLSAGRFPDAVRALVAAGWRVEADGQRQRAGSSLEIEVTSGIDWFDVRLAASFGDASPAMADLLTALRQGSPTVRLGDGSSGVIPEQWLEQWGLAVKAGSVVEGRVRFRRGQAGLLDVLLADRAEVSCDANFAALRDKMATFDRIAQELPPSTFMGTLRDYQREGLGWMRFLREARLGGCLADDMGLGKTVQVLAMLLGRKHERGERCPSLVVVPRSLLFNWKDEAARFTPALSIIEHVGGDRLRSSAFADADVVLTTYGTMRRDIHELSEITFDYVILDEATAIKNGASVTAKAARLLRGQHRLALTGTPIENNMGELWSLFDFLNPGMLGSASWFKEVSGAHQTLDPQHRDLVARVVRPFLLRRTKAQVAKELPARVEQTLYCDLDRRERAFYDELSDHVRASLKTRVARDGVARSTVHILEGLLRLRQAACHRGLIDADCRRESSAKLDALFEGLATARNEGAKSLVFSQFTSLLALVRARLDEDGVTYAYLDGSTRDRKKMVAQFQGDARCQVFLISLKAGGVGLNLTAAQYVFLLDPWWNPAVEAQAIDRAHRMGQGNTVFAYRIIARNTVEEKVAELQRRKRELAFAVLGEDAGGMGALTKDDLELLLGP